jgi:hypothetical protein
MGGAMIGILGRNVCTGRAKPGQIAQNRRFLLVGMPRAAVSVFLHPAFQSRKEHTANASIITVLSLAGGLIALASGRFALGQVAVPVGVGIGVGTGVPIVTSVVTATI